MHCSRCGAKVSDELNFCSSCGERVNKSAVAESAKKQWTLVDSLATIAFAVGVGGMLFLVGLIAVLMDKPIPIEAVLIMVGMYLAAWLTVMLKVIGQLTRFVDAELSEGKTPAKREPVQPAFIPPQNAPILPEYNEPASVTERTTRTLDEVKIERNV